MRLCIKSPAYAKSYNSETLSRSQGFYLFMIFNITPPLAFYLLPVQQVGWASFNKFLLFADEERPELVFAFLQGSFDDL
jgi:hypothetical protein